MDNQKDYYNLDDSICDFLLIYNDRLHSTTKVSTYKTIVNASDKELMENKEKHPEMRETKRKDLICDFS